MLVGLDTETWPITVAEPTPRLVCVQFDGGTPSTRGIVKWDDPALESILVDLLTHQELALTRAAFDILVLLRHRMELWPLIRAACERDAVHDVSIRGRLIANAYGRLKIDKPYTLEHLALRAFGVQLDKGADTYRLRYNELHHVPVSSWPREAYEYAALDAYWAREVAIYQDTLRIHTGVGLDILANEGHQVRTSLALAVQATRGMDTDPERARALDAKMRTEIAELEWWVESAGLARVGGTKKEPRLVKTRAAAEAAVASFAGAVGLEPKRTASGKLAVSKSSLTDLELPKRQYVRDTRHRCPRCATDSQCNPDHIAWIHELDAFRSLGGLQALHSKWLPLLLAPRIFTNYSNPMESGRTSSWGAKDRTNPFWGISTNTQNWPRPHTYAGVRECVRARPGHRLGISDWGGLEMCTHAQNEIDLFGRSTLGELINAGVDVHAALAEVLLDLSPGSYDPKNPRHKEARQDAKPVGFGDMGLLGPKKLVTFARDNYGRVLSEQQAREYLDKRHRMLPEIVQYHRKVKRECPFGELSTVVQPRSLRVRGGCMATDAANSPFQGLASDIAGTALWALLCCAMDPTSILYGCFGILFIHDENVTEFPDDENAPARLAEQDRIMIAAGQAWCPDVRFSVESGLSTNYKK